MKSWKVDLDLACEKQFAADLSSGALTADDRNVLLKWVKDVEDNGLPSAQANRDWRDHELTRGQWTGHRAISFSFRGRVIYRVVDVRLIVEVVRVTPDHNDE